MLIGIQGTEQQTIVSEKVLKAWHRALERERAHTLLVARSYDGIVGSSPAVFSDHNPYAKRLYRCVARCADIRERIRAVTIEN